MGFARLGRNVKISDKASIYEAEKMEIGDNSRIDDFCVVSGKIVMGRNVHIAPLCLVAGGNPGITFEDFSGLAYHVQANYTWSAKARQVREVYDWVLGRRADRPDFAATQAVAAISPTGS